MKSFLCFLLLYYFISEIVTNEFVCVLNGKKFLNRISDKFLSFTIDPAILLSGLNIGASTTQLAKQLGPAYIRIAGPSTRYLHFDELDIIHPSKVSTLKFTRHMWKYLNEWLSESNLEPIFAINGKNATEDVLSTRTLFPLLKISDEMNLDCLWQVNYETSSSLAKYRDELEFLKYMLNTFPAGKNLWKIIGGDMSLWFESESLQNIKSSLGDIINTTEAIMWQMKDNHIPEISTNLSIWLEMPKSQQPITFGSAVAWAKVIGEAALAGYDAIFREPRLFEIITETPVFWVTLLFKKLMGRNVLEIKPNKFANGKISVYCHCSRTQNHFSRRGAITIMGINSNEVEDAILLKVPTNTARNTEVRSYILNSDCENSTITYLNAEKLNMAKILNKSLILEPKLRRARSQKHLILNLPPKSIGFFVIPDARVPICISNEDDTNLLLKEMHEAQSISFTHQSYPEIGSRIKETAPTLKDLYLTMEKELENDEKYYCNVAEGTNHTSETWKSVLLNNFKEISPQSGNRTSEVSRISLLADVKRKKEDLGKRKSELAQKISDKSKSFKNIFNKTSDTCGYFDEIHTNVKREVREAKGHGRGGGRGHGRRKPKTTFVLRPKKNEPIKKPKRDVNIQLLEEKTKELSREAQRNIRTDVYGNLVQPEYLYKDLITTERLELKQTHDEDSKDGDKDLDLPNEPEEGLKEVIRELQSYFNQREDGTDTHISFLDLHDDYGYTNIPMRFKRSSHSDGYTEEDIRYYKLLMNSNIRHMRENMAKQKWKHLSKGKDGKIQPMTVKLKQKQQNLAHLRLVPTHEQKKFNLVRPLGTRMRNGIRLFENALVQQKTSDDSQQFPTEKTVAAKLSARGEEIDDETKKLIRTIKSELRNKRLRSARRIKRRIDLNRLENNIKETAKAVAKDAKYVLPKIDDINISIILPNEDEIALSNDVNEIGVEFHHSKSDGRSKSEATASPSTNSNTDISSVSPTPKVVAGRLKNQREDSTHIQKIGKRREDNILDKILKEISNFVDDVTDKISSCFIF